MKYIIISIPELKYVKVIFEDEFLGGNEFITQNEIIQILDLLDIKADVRLMHK